jgi:hypothetical protein
MAGVMAPPDTSPDEHVSATVVSPSPNQGPFRVILALLAAAMFVGDLLLHKPISDVCDWLVGRYGMAHFNRAALLAIGLGSVALALAVVGPRMRRTPRRAVIGLALLIAASVAAHRLLLVANVELIHFPQYAILTALLLATGMDPLYAWGLATGLGVLDETYQHLVIYAGRQGTYLDFNDMILNTLGVCWAMVLYAARTTRARAGRWRASALVFGLGAAIGIALVMGQSGGSFFRRAATGRNYHVMTVGEAVLCATLLGILVIWAGSTRSPGNSTT